MKNYADPYVVGFGIGVVLLAAYVVAGRGLGASGAFNSVAAAAAVSAGADAGSSAFAPYLRDGGMLRDWLVWEIVGVIVGAFVSARLAGRARLTLGSASSGAPSRIVYAFAGGALMGVGARFARGCTSGQALTGGALLSVGSWIFILSCFIAAFAFAPVMRKQWQ